MIINILNSMNQGRFPYGKVTLASFGYFTNNLTWAVYNSTLPLLLTENFEAYFGVGHAIIPWLIGLIMILDNVSSIIIQPYVGQWSDRIWVKKLGRRMPFIVIALPIAALFFGLIGTFAQMFVLLFIAITGFQVAMAFYKAPAMSLVPDILPRDYRSQGSGVLNVVGSSATIIGLLIMGSLFNSHRILSYWLLSIIMIICLVILLIGVREKQDADFEKQEKKLSLVDSVKGVFKEDTKGLLIMLFSLFFTASGYNVIETFITTYSKEVLKFPEETGFKILAIFVIMSVLLAIPAGLLGRRIGALNACILALIGLSIAIIPLTIISLLPSNTLMQEVLTIGLWNTPRFGWTSIPYLLLVLILGFGWIVLSINNMVVIWNMAPKGRTATFTGYFYLFHHLAHAISPNLAGGVFSVYRKINVSLGYDRSGYTLLFTFSGVCFTIALILMLVVKRIKTKELIQIKDTKEYLQQRLEKKEYPILLIPMLLFGVGLRQNEDLLHMRKEHLMERRELRIQTRALKLKQRELRRRFFGAIDDLLELQIKEINEHKQLVREIRKSQRAHKRELRTKLIDSKIKEKLEKDFEEKKEE